MEEWSRLGETVVVDLKIVVNKTYALLCAVDSTREKLQPWAAVSVTEELARRDIGDNPVALLGRKHPSLPSADLDRAGDELVRLGAHHIRIGHTFLYYGRGAGLGDGNAAAAQIMRDWRLVHRTARGCGVCALMRVRVAAAQTRAFEDAVRSARSFPPMSPGWTGWMAAADRLAACAVVSCSMALRVLWLMHAAVEKEHKGVELIVKARPERAGGRRPRPRTQ